MGYKNNAFNGVSWMGFLRFSTRIITFIRLAILARILSPLQFGIFGIATLILSLLEILTETGINVFLIQQKDQIEVYIDSAWFISILRGIIIFFSLALFALPISSFFNSKDSFSVILLISLVPLIRGFINPSIIKIQKEIKFHKEFYLRFTLFLIDAAIAITTAFITKSAESFAYGLIGAALIEVFFSFLFFRPFPRLCFDWHKVKHIIKVSWWVNLTGIFSYFAENGDNAVVGKILGTVQLGFYQVAYKLSTLPISEITNVINTVVFPIYSKFSSDEERLKSAFIKVTLISSFLSLILGGFIFIFAKELILIIVGDKWLVAVSAVKILSVYGVLRTIFGNFSPMFLSLGKQNYVAKMTFIRCFGLLVTIFPLTIKFGLVGAGLSALISILVEIPAIIYFSRKAFRKI